MTSNDATQTVAKEIKAVCLNLLARREHSQKELLNKLLIKGYDRNEVLPVLEDLAQQAWQSDSRYAESYARHRIQKGYGPLFVAYQLRQNGVDAEGLENIAQSVAGNWMDVLEQVYRKKYNHETVLDRNEWAKRSRFLLHRGFSGAMVSDLLEHLHIKLI